MSTEKKIRTFINENFFYDESKNHLKIEDSFLENGILDSTGVMELVAFIEENFGFHVEDNELVPENLDSIKGVMDYIEKKQNKSAAVAN
ncbi:acyl carrier protein [candidate division KSB1 bacterium]|nr:acyl carrier protein [candidate division KSB1 bacterium]